MSNNRYAGMYGAAPKKPVAGVQQSLSRGSCFLGYQSGSQPATHNFTGAQRLPHPGASHGQRQINNLPRGILDQGPGQPEFVPNSQQLSMHGSQPASLLYGSEYASQSQPSLGHESQSLVIPVSDTPQRAAHGGHRHPTHWSQQHNSSLARGLLNRAESTPTPPHPGPQAVAKLQIEQMMSMLEIMSTRLNELTKPSDFKQHIDHLTEHVDQKLAELTVSLDVPARFNVLQSAVETLQCQQRELSEDVKQRNQKPVATICHVPTQVSPPPAPPLQVAASAQISSPMLAVLRTRVSAGTQMTPQHQYGTSGLHASDTTPEMKTTKPRNLHGNQRPAQVCHGTSMSPPGAHHTAEPCHEQGGPHSVSALQEPNKKVRTVSTRVPADGTRATKQVLSNATNTQMHQRKPQEDTRILGKENGRPAHWKHHLGDSEVVVPVNRRSKKKRSEQVDKSAPSPALKKPRQVAVDDRVMRAKTACAPHTCTAPTQSHVYDGHSTEVDAGADSSVPSQQPPVQGRPNSIQEACRRTDNAASPAPADHGCLGVADAARQQSEHSEGLEVCDSGQRTGGSVALVVSGATVSVGSLQQPHADCQDLYQQLIVGKRSSKKASGDEADSSHACNKHTNVARPKTAAAASQALQSVLQKAKASSRAGPSAALPPQPKPHRLAAVAEKPRRAPVATGAAAKHSSRGQHLPVKKSAIKAKAAEPCHGRTATAEATVAPRGGPGRATAAKRSGRAQTPPKPPTATQRISTSRRRAAGSKRPSFTSSYLFAVDQTPRRGHATVATGQSHQDMATIICQRKRETALMRRSGVLTMQDNETDSYMMPAQEFSEL